jgi:hypothetical protein
MNEKESSALFRLRMPRSSVGSVNRSDVSRTPPGVPSTSPQTMLCFLFATRARARGFIVCLPVLDGGSEVTVLRLTEVTHSSLVFDEK